MTRPTTRRPARAALVTAVALGLAGLAGSSHADSSYALTARTFDTRGPTRVCNDFFCNTFTIIAPQEVIDQRAGPPVAANERWAGQDSATSAIGDAGALARVKLQAREGDIQAGAAASAGISSVFHSAASATLRTEFVVRVEIDTDGFILQTLAQLCGRNCPLTVDFLHHTTGRFISTGDAAPGSFARFSETLRISSPREPATDDMVGEAAIVAGARSGAQPTPSATGAWSAGDFLAPQVDAQGASWQFSHFESIPRQLTEWGPSDNGELLIGEYVVTLAQTAEAGFADPQAYRVGGGTSMAADFSHTSTFSLGRVYDPTGQIDLSGVPVTVRFIGISAVPEPGSWWLFAAGLGLGGLRLRRCA